MDRMLSEAQNKKARARGAKPSLILLESIRCQIDMACPPLACMSAGVKHFLTPPSGRLACFCKPAQAINYNEGRLPRRPGWSRSRPGEQASSRLFLPHLASPSLSLFA